MHQRPANRCVFKYWRKHNRLQLISSLLWGYHKHQQDCTEELKAQITKVQGLDSTGGLYLQHLQLESKNLQPA